VFAVLGATLAMFVWGRWRYDLVAILALLALLASGVLPFEQAFDGFSHPAVITVAAVLVLSRALQNAGLVDVVVRVLAPLKGKMTLQLVAQTVIVAVLSAFMNNVGALALMLPVALRQAYRDGYAPAIALMPLAFGSLLGGLTTLIGTPPNIIVSTFRARELGEPYGMFAFAPVGGAVALAGVAFVTLVGWRLLPKDRRGGVGDADVRRRRLRHRGVRRDRQQADRQARSPTSRRSSTRTRRSRSSASSARRAAASHRRLRAGPRRRRAGGRGRDERHQGAARRERPALEEDKAIERADLGNDEVTVQEVIVAPGSSLENRTPGPLACVALPDEPAGGRPARQAHREATVRRARSRPATCCCCRDRASA
jgi:hypothetical protein